MAVASTADAGSSEARRRRLRRAVGAARSSQRARRARVHACGTAAAHRLPQLLLIDGHRDTASQRKVAGCPSGGEGGGGEGGGGEGGGGEGGGNGGVDGGCSYVCTVMCSCLCMIPVYGSSMHRW